VTVAAAPTITIARVEPAEIDPTTLDGCRAGDRAALTAFVVRYERTVFAFLSRTLGAGPHVEDLAQEVFIRACRALRSFDATGKARVSTWLLTIARRVAIDAGRKRRVPTAALDVARAPTSQTPETERRRAEIGRAVERAVDGLSDAQRAVFVLAEFHDLDMKEIALVLEVPENTAKTRLFRARERLRALLKGVWEEDT
jgi:RNA polymerase sigma-70 factor, ECF subfamily